MTPSPLSLDFQQLLIASHKVALIPHERPDADALGSTLALCWALDGLGKDVRVLVGNQVKDTLRFLPGFNRFTMSHSEDSVSYLGVSDLVVICDTHEPSLLGPWLPDIMQVLALGPGRVFVIDHHLPRERVEFPVGWLDPSSSSTSEMMLTVLKQLDCQIGKEIAQNLMAGIVWDTTRFSNSNTYPKTLSSAAELVEHGADVMEINARLFSLGSPSEVRFKGEIYSRLCAEFEGKYAWVTVTEEMMERHNVAPAALSGLGNELKLIDGVKIVAVLAENGPNVCRVSLRGNDGYNVERIARRFPGGGGHAAAAGCTIHDRIEGAARKLRQEISKDLDRI